MKLERTEEMGSMDLATEYNKADYPMEAYAGKNLEVLWYPQTKRAGVDFGDGAIWTDAKDPQDAIRLAKSGRIIN